MSDHAAAFSGPIANGTVGWEDDGGLFADMGDVSNDGNTFVRVTLFRGRSPADAQDQSVAQGQKVLCRILEGVSFPPRGAKVIVAIPEPGGTIPGNPVILGVINTAASKNANTGPGDKVIAASAGNARVALLGNGAIVLATNDQNTPDSNSVFLKVAPTGLQFVAPWGVLVFDATGFRVRHHTGASFTMGGMTIAGAPLPMESFAKISAALVKVDGTQVLCGPDTPIAVWQPATYAPDPAGGGSPVLLTAISSACVRFAVP